MKKLMVSRRSIAKKEHKIRFRSNSPKRTIVSGWIKRNDSTNVGSILQPEKYYVQPPNHSAADSDSESGKGVYKKCFICVNTCYCREPNVKPKLMFRSRTCSPINNNNLRNANVLRRPSLQYHTDTDISEGCHCKEFKSPGAATTSNLAVVPTLNDISFNGCRCLQYTQSREDYEMVFKRQQEIEDLRADNYSILADDNNERISEDETYSLSTVLGTRRDATTRTTFSSYDREESGAGGDDDGGGSRTLDLHHFRTQHYFKTHAGDALSLSVKNASSGHTCVHQFQLDNRRLLPEPLNVDPYGRSRCSICSRPIKSGTVQLSTRSDFSDDKLSRKSLRNLTRCSELRLVPRCVSIGSDKSMIELRLDMTDKDKIFAFAGRFQKPHYINTFALRQQRMSC